jgi:type IV secretory pathway VirB2 component (pilin)
MERLFLLAQAKINPNDIGLDPVTNADTALGDLLTVVYGAAGVVAVIVIVIGGYLYVFSNGTPNDVKRGKDAIIGGVVGLVIVIMAFTITQFVLGRFQ